MDPQTYFLLALCHASSLAKRLLQHVAIIRLWTDQTTCWFIFIVLFRGPCLVWIAHWMTVQSVMLAWQCCNLVTHLVFLHQYVICYLCYITYKFCENRSSGSIFFIIKFSIMHCSFGGYGSESTLQILWWSSASLAV